MVRQAATAVPAPARRPLAPAVLARASVLALVPAAAVRRALTLARAPVSAAQATVMCP